MEQRDKRAEKESGNVAIDLPQVADGDAAAVGRGNQGLFSRSFVGLLITQFLGAMNDNMFRWLIVPIGKECWGSDSAALVLSLGAVMFVLPFLLWAAPAGWLADRFPKHRVIFGCKVLEIICMAAGVAAILSGDVYVMLVVLFCMGSQSALFGPSKYGSIPEIVRADRIAAANGLVGMTTIAAIVAGTVLGGLLYDWTKPLGQSQWWLSAAALVGTAAAGTATALLIRPLRAANEHRAFVWNFARETWRDLSSLFRLRPLFWAAVGSAMFWSIAGLFQLNADRFAANPLQLEERADVGWVLAAPVVGLGLGNLLAGLVSRRRIEMGIVPLAALGMAFNCAALYFVPAGDGTLSSTAFRLSAAWLFFLGLSAGAYDVPLLAFLQYRSPIRLRGGILAVTSMLAFTGTIAASGVFWLLNGVLGLSAAAIFLLCALGTAAVAIVSCRWLLRELVRFLFQCLCVLIYRVRVEGIEHLPARGGVLLVSNHVTWIDGPMLVLRVPRRIRMVAYADYFDRWWLRWLGYLAEIIPIRPGRRQVVEAIRLARDTLRQGCAVGVFAEGSITRDGQLQPFQPGFLAMLGDSGAPVVPVYLGGLWGSVFSYESGRFMRFFWRLLRCCRYPVTVRFGPPIVGPTDPEQVRAAVLALAGGSARVE